MAKKSMIEREKKRNRVVRRFKTRHLQLKAVVKSSTTTHKEKQEAMLKLQKLPKDASPVRLRNRCSLTGRAKGYYRKFGLGRNKLREAAVRGDIPGLVKASW